MVLQEVDVDENGSTEDGGREGNKSSSEKGGRMELLHISLD